VVAATGYVRDLEPLVGQLGVLAANGCPACHGATTAQHAPGLYFIGFVRKMSGQLLPMRAEAKQIAHAVAAALKREPRSEGAHAWGGSRKSVSIAPSESSQQPSPLRVVSTGPRPREADDATA
jgi:hypothetical protein